MGYCSNRMEYIIGHPMRIPKGHCWIPWELPCDIFVSHGKSNENRDFYQGKSHGISHENSWDVQRIPSDVPCEVEVPVGSRMRERCFP